VRAFDKIYIDKESFIGCNSDICWNYQPSNESIEYTRADAFIEKVCEWLDDELCCYIKAQDFTIDHKRLNKDLRKHLEDEI
jgi:hypothetical protein